MRLLFDQNLSHVLAARLHDVFPSSLHVRSLSMEEASDEEIWEYARANNLCVVTQDSDFAERSRLYGAPPKVVWLRCGNATTRQVESILRHNCILISELIHNPELHYIEII